MTENGRRPRMQPSPLARGFATCLSTIGLCWGVFILADEQPPLQRSEETRSPAGAAEDGATNVATSLEVARERAQLMHELYGATLDVMHHRYFHGERAIVPARAMEDIFDRIKSRSQAEARWISVNMKPMSISHKPKTEFEKRAAEEISRGSDYAEIVEDGFYRRAGAIPLRGECVSCHGGFFRETTRAAKFAGLVISIPVDPKVALVSE